MAKNWLGKPSEHKLSHLLEENLSFGKKSNWREVKWRRVFLLIGIVFVALWAGVLILRGWMYIWGTIEICRNLELSSPEILLRPVDPVEGGLALLKGKRTPCGAFLLQLPSDQILQLRASGVDHSGCFVQLRDRRFLILDSSIGIDVGFIKQNQALRKAIGEETLQSNYEFASTALNVTPDQVKIWHWPARNQRCSVLLLYKSSLLHGTTNLYRIKEGQFRGFQSEEVEPGLRRVFLELYDPEDRHYSLILSSSEDSKGVWGQPEINALVASIQSVR